MEQLTPRDLVDRFGGGSRLAELLGNWPSAVSNWISKGRIPRERWPDLIELAERQGVEGVTFETLRSMANHPLKEVAR